MAQLERKDIAGWGVDLDHANRPAYPMEKHPPEGTGRHWSELARQTERVKIFQSIERPRMTAVFGTSAPPRGLSGVVRSAAYTLGENRKLRWMTLLLADRIDVVEGLLSDVAKGYIPNVFAEMGMKAEWKHNRAGFYKKTAVLSIGLVTLGYVIARGRSKIATGEGLL